MDFWKFEPTEMVHLADQTIAGLAVFFFYAAILLNYFTFAWLFDRRLSVIMVVVQLVCQQFWDFAETGLPQLLLLFLFSGAMLCVTRLLMAQADGRRQWPWIGATGVFFGLMALAHPLTLTILVGAVIFVGVVCATKQPRVETEMEPLMHPAVRFFAAVGVRGLLILAIVAAIFVPWLVRNAQVCGDFRGLSWQSKSHMLRGSESVIMRTLKEPDETVQPSSFVPKMFTQTMEQMDRLYYFLGKVPMALVFFVALLHNFKRRETRVLRWGLFLMWILAVGGMSLFGFADYDLLTKEQSNDLHVLFIPFFAAYGLAFVLNLWSRLEIDGHALSSVRVINGAFTTLLIGISAMPLLTRYLTPPALPVNFPPYFPSIIAKIGDWYTERDVICSDMPWGVAWYTDRRSLWLPLAKRDFITLNTFTFDNRINGLFLTPVSGYRGLQTDIDAGEFREWSLFIRHDKYVLDPALRASDHLPFNVVNDDIFFLGARNYVLYADRNRWSDRQ